MKKHRFVFVMLAILLVFGLTFVSCDNATTGNRTKFEGRWVMPGAINMGFTEYSFTFSGSNFVFRKADVGGHESNNRIVTGTYTYTDNVITWIPAQGENWNSFSQTYSLDRNTLQLGLPHGQDQAWSSTMYVKQ